MTSLYSVGEIVGRIAREEEAAKRAKCEKARQAHHDLAYQYKHKLVEIEAIETTLRMGIG